MTRHLGFRGTVAIVAIVAAALAGCDASGGGGVVAIGSPVPAYGAPTLAGDSISLAELQGEHVLLNIWATWCVPCRQEMPDLQEIHEGFGPDGLRVVAVSIDQAYAKGEIEQFVDRYGIEFTVLHDPQGTVTRLFSTVGVPETFLIGPDGTLVSRWFGQIDPSQVRARLEEEVRGSRPPPV